MNSTAWSIGYNYIAWTTNTQIVRSLGNKSPCKVLAGQKPNQGLSTLPIYPTLLSNLQKEAYLHSILNMPVDVLIEEVRVNINVSTERAVNGHKTDSNATVLIIIQIMQMKLIILVMIVCMWLIYVLS